MLFFPREDQEEAKIVVIATKYRGKWLFVRHKDRTTFEMPAGHRESGESLLEAARRELYEETGAVDYAIWPVTAYGVLQGDETNYGQLYFAAVEHLGNLPPYEIAERFILNRPPEALTYATIQHQLLVKAERWLVDNHTLLYCVFGADIDNTRLLKKMGRFYINGVYSCPDKGIRAPLSALADDKEVPLELCDHLGEGLEDAFFNQGIMIFKEFLEREKGCSIALGIYGKAFEAIKSCY
ncbi:MAG: NUDIX domain-containing protein [Peptococcaceae bacterium]|jgi:8-oxo-dGTP diphosphatase|nr:NUDIX domain-containing protein [Peptococcaceae bacterium]